MVLGPKMAVHFSPKGLGLNVEIWTVSDNSWTEIMGCFGQPRNINSGTVFG